MWETELEEDGLTGNENKRLNNQKPLHSFL